MNLPQQLQLLIDQAPQDGTTPNVIKEAVNPVLEAFAKQLQYLTYFTYQTLQKNWVITTLSNRNNPNLEKTVIYAFSTLKDAQDFQGNDPDPQLIALEIPVIHILFQLFSLESLDSIVFMEMPGNLTSGTEVHRQALQEAIQAQLAHYRRSTPPTRLA